MSPAAGGATPAPPEGTTTLDALYTQHWTDLVRYINSMTSDRHQAEEIAQETMLRAWRNVANLVPERGSVWGWLSRVAHNIMVDRIRYKRARPAEVDESAALYAPQVAADHSASVANSLYVLRAIEQLPRAHREVLYLIYYRDRTCEEAAEILQVPVGTVKSRLHYALRSMRSQLTAERAEQGHG